jgi:hypothetical protein
MHLIHQQTTRRSSQPTTRSSKYRGSHTPDWQPKEGAAALIHRTVALKDRSDSHMRYCMHLSLSRQARQPKEGAACTLYTSRQQEGAPSQQQDQANTSDLKLINQKKRPHQHKERVTEVVAAIGE